MSLATWRELSVSSRRAAQVLLEEGLLRSSVSRSYYAAYSAVTDELPSSVTLGSGRSNPRHTALVDYIQSNLPGLEQPTRRRLSKAIRILWKARADADYRPGLSIDEPTARNALREASSVLRELRTDDGQARDH